MNKAISIAKGEYCIFMNSGDSFVDDNVLSDIANFIAIHKIKDSTDCSCIILMVSIFKYYNHALYYL